MDQIRCLDLIIWWKKTIINGPNLKRKGDYVDLSKEKKNYEAQFQDNQMLNDEIEEKWQKKTSTIKPSYHGKLTSHNSGCEVELTS